jgi:ABC-type Mn2+/Zn2+ transport system permease subunit/Mn-dependent DtxR family transcriptional regulator
MDLVALLIDPLRFAFMQRALLAAVLVGIVCGTLGCYIVLRRMALIGDALAHSVLPGVAIAYMVGVDFLFGAVGAGVATALLIGWITTSSRVKEDAAIGVVFTGAFALGIVLITIIQSRSVDLLHMLLGNVLGVEDRDLMMTAAITAVVLITVALLFKELLLHAFDPVMAAATGLPVRGLHYLLMLLLSLTVVASLKTVGLVLVVAMLITPASTAYLLTDRFGRMLGISAAVGVVSAIAGLYLSYYWNVSSGGAIVLVATFIFFLAFLFAPQRGLVIRQSRVAAQARLTAQEDVLKQLFVLEGAQGEASAEPVAAREVADRLGAGVAAVRRRMAALRRRGWMKGGRLSERGEDHARELVRAHRLWERYLVDRGGLSGEEVHQEAERLEHLDPGAMAAHLDELLGSPESDPHGTPIPRPRPAVVRLSDLPVGSSAVVAAIRATSAESLHALADLGITPSTPLTLLGRENGSVRVRTAAGERTLPMGLAAVVDLRPER